MQKEATVIVVSRIHALPAVREDVQRELRELVQHTRTEDGCVSFDLHQSLDDPCRFLITERWASRRALDQHLQQPRLQAWLLKSKTMVAEPIEITLWRTVSEPD